MISKVQVQIQNLVIISTLSFQISLSIRQKEINDKLIRFTSRKKCTYLTSPLLSRTLSTRFTNRFLVTKSLDLNILKQV